MSFRELRSQFFVSDYTEPVHRYVIDFTETMKSLEYHRIISMENFRNPNFELVADVLYWLANRLDPLSDLSDDISTESARVDFLKTAARLMMAKANIKLNIKKLYQGDGYAVQELQKISSLLFKATSMAKLDDGECSDPIPAPESSHDISSARGLSANIIDSGGQLYTILGNEPELKLARDRTMQFIDELSHNLESDNSQFEIEKAMRNQINSLADHLALMKTNYTNLEGDRAALQSQIDRKQMEIERAMKRLRSIKKVKPAFMAEYESMELELKSVYRLYMEKYTNLCYLEDEQKKVQERNKEKRLESERDLHKMRRHLREEELRILRGEQNVDEDHIDDKDEQEEPMSSDEEDEEEMRNPAISSNDRGLLNRNGSNSGSAVRLSRPGAADPRGRNKGTPGKSAPLGAPHGSDGTDEESDMSEDEEQELDDEDEDDADLYNEEDEEDDDEDDTDF